jgi:glycosyltransferase involved in cell wall biosynthesis
MMIIAFENLFGRQYEGGANWLEVSLLSLGLLPKPPTCLVVGATRELLPDTLREARYVVPIPLVRASQSKAARVVRGVSRRVLRQEWEDPAIAAVAARYEVDLWVGFSGFEGLGRQRKLLVWYPDFQYRYFPELFDSQEIRDRERQWDYVAERADGIIAISESVRSDALTTHPQISAKVHVGAFPAVFHDGLLGLEPDEVRRGYHLPERFFLVCNQFWKHKNHALVLHALSQLRTQGHDLPIVAFTGRPHDYRNPDAFSELLRYVHQQNLNEYCRFLGVVPRAEQLALIRAAEAVIHPSKFEGRGAIVEEAHILGTQVLCSDLPVHRELNAPGTLFFPVDGESELAALMQRDYARSRKATGAIIEDCARLALTYGNQLQQVCADVSGRPQPESADSDNYALARNNA